MAILNILEGLLKYVSGSAIIEEHVTCHCHHIQDGQQMPVTTPAFHLDYHSGLDKLDHLCTV